MKTCRKKLAVVLVIALFALEPAFAFHPKDYGHLGITRAALGGITVVVQGQTLRFSDRAIDQIVQANKETDHPALHALSFLHFDSEDFAGSTVRLEVTKATIIDNIAGPSPDGAAARKLLGGMLHTLQDYYSHSNWINLTTYAGTIDTRLGRQSWGQGNTGPPPTATIDIPTCETDHNNLEGTGFTWLTTGYFDDVDWCYSGPEDKGKCRHGGIPILCPGGISKDEPGRDGFPVAKQLAIQASIDYVNQILNDPAVANNPRAIKALMDVGGTLAVAVDTTNMQTEVPLLQAELTNLVNEVRNTEDEPAQYVLVHFDDVQVDPPVVTANATEFLAAVNALQAHGGGCEGPQLDALQEAISASQSQARIFLYSHNTPNDLGLTDDLIKAARAKGAEISAHFPSPCTRFQPHPAVS